MNNPYLPASLTLKSGRGSWMSSSLVSRVPQLCASSAERLFQLSRYTVDQNTLKKANSTNHRSSSACVSFRKLFPCGWRGAGGRHARSRDSASPPVASSCRAVARDPLALNITRFAAVAPVVPKRVTKLGRRAGRRIINPVTSNFISADAGKRPAVNANPMTFGTRGSRGKGAAWPYLRPFPDRAGRV